MTRTQPPRFAAVSQGSNGAVRIKMHNKLAALVVLGKYLGMFDERPQNSNVIYAISDEPMRRSGVAARGARAAGSDAGDWVSERSATVARPYCLLYKGQDVVASNAATPPSRHTDP